ncbi:MAG TPA: methyltransferase [Candidatus Dojkabacteria bacterium]|nr:methyltransferase [Candidatus Dojkabacteria bacterium]
MKTDKYQNLDKSLLDGIYKDLLTKYKDTKQLEQKLKSLIHQIWGSYYTSKPNFKKLIEKIKAADNPKEYVFSLLQIHSSTKERLTFYTEFYNKVFEITGISNTILDMGCGFNPLYFVLDERFKNIRIDSVDIDKDEIEFLNEVFDFFKMKSMQAQLGNVLSFDYSKEYDLVLLLKILPVIEQQSRGQTLNLLKRIKAKNLVVSFPTKSISGKLKGMESNYRELFIEISNKMGYQTQEIILPNELVFVCKTVN